MYVQFKRGGLMLLLGLLVAPLALADGMKIGLGRVAITPSKPVWMAGYASRTEPGTGKLHDLWTKAMAIEDASGNKVVIVTADIIGFSLDMTDAVSKRIEKAHGIPRSNLLFNSSPTLCGPVVKNDGLHITYGLEGANEERAVEYTRELAEMVYQAIDAALKDLAPGTLHWGIGEAMFAKNRRAYGTGGVSNDFNPIGPVDHDVPVLLAKGADLATVLDPKRPTAVYTAQQLAAEPLVSKIRSLENVSMALASSDQKARENANRGVGLAISFISATPYAFAMEGR